MLFSKKKSKIDKIIKNEEGVVKRGEAVVLSSKPIKISSRILLKPVITEKATQLSTLGKYIFEVKPGVNKIEIKKAIKELYNVWPLKVNIIKMHGKEVRYGFTQGREKNRIKAIVTLKKGEKIDLGLTK